MLTSKQAEMLEAKKNNVSSTGLHESLTVWPVLHTLSEFSLAELLHFDDCALEQKLTTLFFSLSNNGCLAFTHSINSNIIWSLNKF